MKEKLIRAVKGAMLILLPLIAAGFPARFFSLEYAAKVIKNFRFAVE